MKLAGVIVLYNKSFEVIELFRQYIDALDKLYIVDNSDVKNLNLYKTLANIGKIKLLETGGNKGIAYALNRAAKISIQEGFNKLLLMDQDSLFSLKMLEQFRRKVMNNNDSEIAIHVPRTTLKKYIDKTELIEEAITSGSIINLDILDKLGFFKEDYFIYAVDYEYCWRVRKNGYQVKRYNEIYLNHQICDFNITKSGKKKYVRIVSDTAFYYAFRNNMYLFEEYRNVLPSDVRRRKKEFIIIWIKHAIRSGHFFHKINFGIKGLLDYRKGVVGKMK